MFSKDAIGMAREFSVSAQQAEEASRILELCEKFGDDDREENTVVVFRKGFKTKDGTTRTYTYAALKINGKWYSTGDAPLALLWHDFVFWLVTEGEPVAPEDLVFMNPGW